MHKEKGSLNYRLKSIDEARNYFLEEIKHNELIRKKNRKTCKTLNYVEQLIILTFTFTACNLIFAFVSLVSVLLGITGSVVGLKLCNNSKN